MDAATSALRLAVADPRLANNDRTDPHLHLTLRQVAMAHNTTATTVIREIGVLSNEPLDLRFR